MRLQFSKAPQGVGLASRARWLSSLPRRAFKQALGASCGSSVQHRRFSCKLSAQAGPRMASGPIQTLQDPVGMEHVAAQLEEFMQIPTASKVWFQGGASQTVTVQHNQRNLAANKMRKYLETYALGAEGPAQATPGLPVELRDTAVFAPSPS
ncbi:hypothetical protein WJX74_003912, partial [Apatococcus lobatus]